uniref:Secreted protein n=1 Tax=Steinernema glaseri TaxID=37863 RepID=A0A1I7ZJ89_9BILA
MCAPLLGLRLRPLPRSGLLVPRTRITVVVVSIPSEQRRQSADHVVQSEGIHRRRPERLPQHSAHRAAELWIIHGPPPRRDWQSGNAPFRYARLLHRVLRVSANNTATNHITRSRDDGVVLIL